MNIPSPAEQAFDASFDRMLHTPTPLPPILSVAEIEAAVMAEEAEINRMISQAQPVRRPMPPGGYKAADVPGHDPITHVPKPADWPEPPAVVTQGRRKHDHYFKPCPYNAIDVYRVIQMFTITDPCIQHALKKLLVAGGRGAGKSIDKDIQEAIDTLQRWQEMRREEAPE